MTKAEYRRNGTIIRTRDYDAPEQAQDALRWQRQRRKAHQGVKRIRHFHYLGGSVA